ncbi:MAG: hypothetical protein FWD15_06310 [Alphaproteobacteria bacterium]|nr:hypothetical protein [Alphaproteobacteria bacterium]
MYLVEAPAAPVAPIRAKAFNEADIRHIGRIVEVLRIYFTKEETPARESERKYSSEGGNMMVSRYLVDGLAKYEGMLNGRPLSDDLAEEAFNLTQVVNMADMAYNFRKYSGEFEDKAVVVENGIAGLIRTCKSQTVEGNTFLSELHNYMVGVVAGQLDISWVNFNRGSGHRFKTNSKLPPLIELHTNGTTMSGFTPKCEKHAWEKKRCGARTASDMAVIAHESNKMESSSVNFTHEGASKMYLVFKYLFKHLWKKPAAEQEVFYQRISEMCDFCPYRTKTRG